MPYNIPVLEKQPQDSRLYNMDFTGRLSEGETVVAVTSLTASPSGLTLGSAAASGAQAQARISGGTSGTKYKVTAVVTTSAGNTLEGEGYLFVRDS